MRGFLLYRLFILILCFVIAFGADESDSKAELSSTSEILASNSLLSFKPEHETAIVAAPDGMIHLMELSSGKILWSFASGSSIYSSFQALPDNHGDDLNMSIEGENFYIDCGEDWKLYLHKDDLKKVEISQTIEEFLRNTPLVLAGGVMLGSKKTTVFLVDSKSGRVIHTCRSDVFEANEAGENPILARNDFEDVAGPSATDLNSFDRPLYIVRTDYALKYTSTKTGKVLWNLQFADFEASLQCERIDKFLGGVSLKDEFRPGDEICQSKPLVYRIRDRTSLESLLMSVRSQNALPGAKFLTLPSADQSPVMPVDKLFRFHQNNEGKVVHTLPARAPLNNDFAIMGLPLGDSNQVVIESSFLTGSYVWSFVLFGSLVLVIVAFLFRMVALVMDKWYKGRKPAVDKNFEVMMMSKKKKLRKPGISKKSANDEKSKKNVFTDETSPTDGFLSVGNTDNQMRVNLFDRHGGWEDGRKIGKLFVSNKEIAMGSNGTIILEGVYEGRPVAVKRLVKTHLDIAEKEIKNLIASDRHQNIVRWYGVEFDQDFVYISLERCTCSLYDLVSMCSKSFENQSSANDRDSICKSDCNQQGQLTSNNIQSIRDFVLWKANGYPSPKLLKLLSNIVCGLVHLHELGIIHRDLKPQNVLVVNEKPLRAKISDMGISKFLARDMSSLSKHATGCGSSGWQAPEQLRHERQTRAVDLFSLGCVLFFCITGGRHPYGESLERDFNIVNDKKDLFLIENIPEALDLISQLLHPNPQYRPTAMEILNHPFFWNPETRLSFLRDVSDRIEVEDREAESEILRALESIKTVVLGGQWDEKMDSAFINDIGRYRRYKYDNVRDLLRVIRNKLNHYRELSKEIQGILGQVPDGFDNYFSSRFPKLLMEVYKVIRRFCREEEIFKPYFENSHI